MLLIKNNLSHVVRPGMRLQPAAEAGSCKAHENPELFHELWLFKCVCGRVNVCVPRGSSTEQRQMERRNVCQRRKLRSVFLFKLLVEEDGIWLGSLLRDRREETFVLLCLGVSFIFFMKLLAVISG